MFNSMLSTLDVIGQNMSSTSESIVEILESVNVIIKKIPPTVSAKVKVGQDRPLCWHAIVLASYYIGKLLYWQAIVLTDHFIDGPMCLYATVVTNHCVDRPQHLNVLTGNIIDRQLYR